MSEIQNSSLRPEGTGTGTSTHRRTYYVRVPGSGFKLILLVSLLFDFLVSALPIIVLQESPSVGLFTHQQGM